jgi:hypothetical protein
MVPVNVGLAIVGDVAFTLFPVPVSVPVVRLPEELVRTGLLAVRGVAMVPVNVGLSMDGALACTSAPVPVSVPTVRFPEASVRTGLLAVSGVPMVPARVGFVMVGPVSTRPVIVGLTIVGLIDKTCEPDPVSVFVVRLLLESVLTVCSPVKPVT